MEDEKGNGLRLVKQAAKGLFILFLVITIIFVVKIINGDTCGRETYTYYKGGALQAAHVLDANNEIVLQHNPYDREKNIDDWRFCFSANTTDAVDIHIIGDNEYLLGHAIVETGFGKHCYNIVFPDNATFNYIGLQCPLCSAANPKLTLYEEILGSDEERVVAVGNVFTVTEDNTLDYVLEAAPSCWESVKYFTTWYLTALILLTLAAGVIVGGKKLGVLFNGW